MRCFVGLKRWDEVRLKELARASGRVQGVIIGDPFCQRRMFQHGNWEMLDLITQARELGLKVALQTPVYVTDRNLRETIDLVSLLQRKEVISVVLAHDLGLVSILRSMGLAICWSSWAETRNSTLSREYVDLLGELGVQYLETDNAGRIEVLQQRGMKVAYRLQAQPVATFGRSCYFEVQAGLPCTPLSRPCHDRTVYLVDPSTQTRLLIDGHALCWDVPVVARFPIAEPDVTTVYAGEIADLPSMLLRSPARRDAERHRELHRRLVEPRIADVLDRMAESSVARSVPLLGWEVASELFALVCNLKPRRILEIGGGCGYSAALLAYAAVDSTIITIEREEALAIYGQMALRQDGLGERISWRIGDALRVIHELEGPFDFLFIDGAKQEYPKYLRAAVPLLSAGAIIVSDNALLAEADCETRLGAEGVERGLATFRALIDRRPFQTTTKEIGRGVTLTTYLGEEKSAR